MRLAAPEHLQLPQGLIRRLILPIWGVLLAFAICAQVVGTWRAYHQVYNIHGVFADLGFRGRIGSEGQLEVQPTPNVGQVAAIAEGAWIYAINGTRFYNAPEERYAELLSGSEGSYVAVTFVDRENTVVRNHYLVRSAVHRAQTQRFSDWLMDIVLIPFLGLLAAGLGLYGSYLLVRRRSNDPVAVILAVGLVGLVLTGDQPPLFLFWAFNNVAVAGEIYLLAYVLAFVPLAVALPAFPNGRYEPRWSAWLAILGPPVGVSIFAASLIQNLHPAVRVLFSYYLLVPLVLAALVAAAVRFKKTPRGHEKQQLKWAFVGFVFGLAAVIAGEVLLASPLVREGSASFGLWVAAVILRAVGSILIPLGVVMSVLELRLNDADSAIGRSAGYALITLLIGAVWAGSTTWINKLLGDTVAPAVATGISTMLAAAIFVPTRERIMKWMEKKFQPALVKLRGLPARLGPWRHDHDPAELARGTLLAIVNGVQASSAALVLTLAQGHQVLAMYETTEDDVLRELGFEAALEERAFPLRLNLDDLLGPVGVLLIGPRTDGASYTSDERSAVALIKGPLAEALRATSRRANRNQVLAEMLTSVDARVARLETIRGAV